MHWLLDRANVQYLTVRTGCIAEEDAHWNRDVATRIDEVIYIKERDNNRLSVGDICQRNSYDRRATSADSTAIRDAPGPNITYTVRHVSSLHGKVTNHNSSRKGDDHGMIISGSARAAFNTGVRKRLANIEHQR